MRVCALCSNGSVSRYGCAAPNRILLPDAPSAPQSFGVAPRRVATGKPRYNPAAGQRQRIGLRMRQPQSMDLTKVYFILFGVLTIAGGIVGYVKAGSVASIIAGSITGVLLLVAAFLLTEHRGVGLATALVISLLLAVQFVPKFLQTGRVMPAGMMSILSVIGVIAAIVAWIKK
jgi:uncharacterized membrane protein (UPF0136 family)